MVDFAGVASATVAFLMYYNALDAGFAYDDTRAIIQNQDLHPSAPLSSLFMNDFWGTPISHSGSHKSYRPVTTFTFKLNSILSCIDWKNGKLLSDGKLCLSPWWFHATNVVLHMLATYLLVVYMRQLLKISEKTPKIVQNNIQRKQNQFLASLSVWITGLLFAMHPVHVEAVAGVVGRADILSGIFFLLSLIFYQKYNLGPKRNRFSQSCDRSSSLYQVSKSNNNLHISSDENENNNNTIKCIPNRNEEYCNQDSLKRFPAATNADSFHQQKRTAHNSGKNIASGTFTSTHARLLDFWSGEKITGVERMSVANSEDVKKSYLIWTCIFAAFSMFSKETGITALGVCLTTEITNCYRVRISEFINRNNTSKPSVDQNKANCDKRKMTFVHLTFTTIMLIMLRLYMMGGTNGAPIFALADNPAAADKAVLTRFLTFSYLPSFNLVHLLMCPNELSFDWSMEAIPLIRSICDTRNLLTLSTYSVILVYGVKIIKHFGFDSFTSSFKYVSGMQKCSKRSDNTRDIPNHVVIVSLVMMILPFIPASNLFFYVGFVVAERVLYIPSMGYCILVGYGLSHLWKHVCNLRKEQKNERERSSEKMELVIKVSKFLIVLFTCVIFITFGVKTFQRSKDWFDEESLYRAGVKINPPKALGNLGNVLTQKGRLIEAEYVFKEAIKYRPNMADVHYNLGVLLQRQNRLNEAANEYKTAIHFRPKLVLAHLNLGMTYDSLGLKKEGLKILQSISSVPDDGLKDPKAHKEAQTSALFNSGKLLLELGHTSEAIRNLLQAHENLLSVHRLSGSSNLSMNIPTLQAVLNLLGEAHRFMNKTKEAEKYYLAALKEKEDHIPAYLTYGKLLSKNKTRHNEAESWFLKAHQLAPLDPSVHLHYGLFLMEADGNRNFEAGQKFQTASELLLGEDKGQTSRKDSRDIDEANLQSSISAYDTTFNAAVAYRQAGRNDLAEKFYRKAVDIKPKDPSSHMNLGAMLHLVGNLREAEDEYLIAWSLSTSLQKTQKNKNEENELYAAQNSIEINIKRLHNIMKSKGMKIKEIIN